MTRPIRPPKLLWLFALGLAGFAPGFFGPLILSPEANQGPLVGILISGPLGVLAGVTALLIVALTKPQDQTQWRLLYGLSALIAMLTVFFILPGR